MFRFLHTADIHLDSPLLNLDNYDNIPRDEFRSATRRAFDNIVALAIHEQVSFVLIAGDVFDGDCADFNTPLYFRKKMEELQAADIRVLVIQGNHDAAGVTSRAFRLKWPDNVHLFRTDRPETVKLDDLGVAVHGQGFAQKAVLEDLSKRYPDPIPGMLNIGLLHTNCGSREGHDPYAPSTPRGLEDKRYHYWALGHIHKRQSILGPGPWIVYPGNPQGRHIGETGERSCVIATVEGERIGRKDHNVDVVRWYLADVATDDCADADACLEAAVAEIGVLAERAADMPLAVRVKLTGRTNAHRDLVRQTEYHTQQLREAVLDRFSERVWIEKLRIKTRPQSASVDTDSVTGELLASLRTGAVADQAFAELEPEFEKALATLPHDPRLPAEHLDLTNAAARALLAGEARELLAARLLDAGGSE